MADKPLVKHTVCIDLPGEPVNCSADTDVTVLLRKHRDVVFDVKLGNNATYTVTTLHPDRPAERFYDQKRKMNVARTTFKDGEQCHIWVGRNFEGSLVLKQGDKELGLYPISKMDCSKGCTNDPKDKPAPMLIIVHDDKEFAKDLVALAAVPTIAQQPVAPSLTAALKRSQGVGSASDSSPFPSLIAPSSADGQADVPQMIHAFSIKQTSGPTVPPELLTFFKSGSDTYKWDPINALSRNFLLAQVAAGLAYVGDASPYLKELWGRAIIVQRNAKGEFTILFSTSTKERKLVGYLLGVYQTHSRNVRVMTLVGGTGSLSAAGRAAWDAGAASISPKTYTGKAMALAIAMDTMAWYYDYKYAKVDAGHPKKDIADLFALVLVDGVMMWVGGVLTEVLLASLFAGVAIALGSSAATIGVIAVGTVIIIVGINYALTATSNAVDANNKVAKLIRSTGKILEQDIPRDYADAYSQSTWPMLAIGATP